MKIRKMKIRNRKIRNRKINNHCKPNVTVVHVYTVSIVDFNLHKLPNIPAHFIGTSVILTVYYCGNPRWKLNIIPLHIWIII